MERVGIIPLHYENYNYGGQLGAYALQKAIPNWMSALDAFHLYKANITQVIDVIFL